VEEERILSGALSEAGRVTLACLQARLTALSDPTCVTSRRGACA